MNVHRIPLIYETIYQIQMGMRQFPILYDKWFHKAMGSDEHSYSEWSDFHSNLSEEEKKHLAWIICLEYYPIDSYNESLDESINRKSMEILGIELIHCRCIKYEHEEVLWHFLDEKGY